MYDSIKLKIDSASHASGETPTGLSVHTRNHHGQVLISGGGSDILSSPSRDWANIHTPFPNLDCNTWLGNHARTSSQEQGGVAIVELQ